ncbi:probable carboxylesterase 5 [Rutidosis leptorrhynchoides]|uniref:probable carboxylesterase 5 n=1 Tax=Rutidosis leptorrhynchoides TaxID=125765 RepID=UPI003A99C801
MASTTEIAHEFAPFLRVYTDGRVERLLTTPRLPPSTDPITGVQSKDIVISTEIDVKSRIFLPKIDPTDPPRNLPLIVYIHGGGFCIGSPINIITQGFLTPFVSQIPSVTIAVGYRLAPEHSLPTAYHDCWAAFNWIAAHANGSGPDPWINEYVDTSRVILVGESAGANLAHYVAVQAGVHKIGLGIRALIAIHPYFSQEEPDKLIQYLYPGSSGSTDDPKLNPGSDSDLDKMACPRVLIIVAEKDSLKPRGVEYNETLRKSKWEGKVELVENEGEGHCFHLFNPSSEKAKDLTQMLISFVNQVA